MTNLDVLRRTPDLVRARLAARVVAYYAHPETLNVAVGLLLLQNLDGNPDNLTIDNIPVHRDPDIGRPYIEGRTEAGEPAAVYALFGDGLHQLDERERREYLEHRTQPVLAGVYSYAPGKVQRRDR